MFFWKTTTRVQMADGFDIIANAAIDEESLAIASGVHEPEVMELCRPWITRESICLDCGAGIGFFSCFFGSLVDHEAGGRVYAFEPVEAFYHRLAKNIRINHYQNKVIAYREALGRSSGKLKLHIIPHAKTNNAVGENRIKGHHRIEFSRSRWKESVAPMTTLDEWLHRIKPRRCDLIKLDVEGSEFDVLQGGAELITIHRPIIIGEFNPYWMSQTGHGFADVTAMVAPLKYNAFRLVGEDLFPVRSDLIARYPEVPTYMLIPEEKIKPGSKHDNVKYNI